MQQQYVRAITLFKVSLNLFCKVFGLFLTSAGDSVMASGG